jgi:hypothetical protein|tara:strand:- start:902 stop:1183 length:282 start_codon:yes stop_codon:yes gene_type:complete
VRASKQIWSIFCRKPCARFSCHGHGRFGVHVLASEWFTTAITFTFTGASAYTDATADATGRVASIFKLFIVALRMNAISSSIRVVMRRFFSLD